MDIEISHEHQQRFLALGDSKRAAMEVARGAMALVQENYLKTYESIVATERELWQDLNDNYGLDQTKFVYGADLDGKGGIRIFVEGER